MRELIPYAASWLLTFALHSTLWLGGAALAMRLRRNASAALRDFLWRAALAASLLTPSLQLAAGVAPLGGAWRVAPAEPAPEVAVLAATPASAGALQAATDLLPAAPASSVAPPTFSPGSALPASSDAALDLDARAAAAAPTPWRELLLGVWAALAVVAVGALLCDAARLRRSLRGRRGLTEGASARALERLLRPLGRRAPRVRLTESQALTVPIALGLLRPEICVPRRALRDLGPAQQRALIGHELAHLLRQDPLWLGVFALAARLFWFQPLLRVARREAHHAAEELCDAWSARRTGDPVALADCLVEVARWLVPGRAPLAAACMARPDSPLRQRVTRLLERGGEGRERLPAWARGSAAAAIVGAALLLPAISCHAAPVWPAGSYLVSEDADPAAELAVIREQIGWLIAELDAARTEAGASAPDGVSTRLAALQDRLRALREMADSISSQLTSYSTSR